MWTYQQYSLNLNTVVWTFSKRHKTKIEFWKKNLFFCMYVWIGVYTKTQEHVHVSCCVYNCTYLPRINGVQNYMNLSYDGKQFPGGQLSLFTPHKLWGLYNTHDDHILEMPMHRSLRKRKVSPVSFQDSSLIETTCLDKHLGHLKVNWITKHHSSWSSSSPSSSWSWSLTW